MRVVVDTNTLISALLWQGTPYRLLVVLRETDGIDLFTSPALLAELSDVLARPHLASRFQRINKTAEGLVDEIASAFVVLRVVPLSQPVCRDPDDDEVLACAIGAQADFIVSGDADLLSLEVHSGIRILTAAQALAVIEEKMKGSAF